MCEGGETHFAGHFNAKILQNTTQAQMCRSFLH